MYFSLRTLAARLERLFNIAVFFVCPVGLTIVAVASQAVLDHSSCLAVTALTIVLACVGGIGYLLG